VSAWWLAALRAKASHHADTGRPVLIEAVLGASDVPPLLQDLTQALAASGQ